MAEADGLTWRDHAVSCAFGVGVALLAWFSGNSAEIPPDLWTEVSAVIGLRPPPTVFPGLWRCMAGLLFRCCGPDQGLCILRIMGPISLGLLSVLTFRLFDDVLPDTLRLRMRRKGWSRRVVRFVLLQGVVFFVCSDPVWRAGQVLSPTMLRLLFTLAAFRFFFHALRTSSRWHAILMSAVLGLLSAETPFALLPMAAFPLIVILRMRLAVPEAVPLSNPLIRLITFRRMTLAFVCGWLLMMTSSTVFFCSHDGLAAHGWDIFTYFIHYLHHYVQLVQGAASPAGWVFIIGVVVFPLAMSSVHIGRATDDDKFLVYLHGVYFGFVGILSFLQSSGWKPFWFWTWVDVPPPVGSGYLLCLCLLATSMTAMMSLCVLGVEIYFRNYRRIAITHFQDAVEETPAAEKMVKGFRLADQLLRTVLIYEPVLALAMVVPFRFSQIEHRMEAIVNDGIRQTAEECGDAGILFADGAFDAAVEVAAALQGRQLKVLSMMSDSSPYEIYLRTRGEKDEENSGMLAIGAADTLRTWVRSRPECATNIALQLGFELWRHDKLPMPVVGGLVARTAGFSPEAAAEWKKSAICLANRILELYNDGDPMAVANNELRSKLMFLQWRIARMCRLRADAADKTRDMTYAMEESELADRLDEKNVAYSRIRKQMDWVAQQKGMRLTPREGLKIGLERADFRLAKTFAQQVLLSDPNNTGANFAMGMGYFIDEQYSRAEVYLKRCMLNKPNEPAVLNNLAIVQMRLGKLDEAETNSAKAVKLYPGSQSIRKTYDHIRQMGEKQKSAATREDAMN